MKFMRFMAITLILITLFNNKVVAEDETEMWAEPGMSIGNIKLSYKYGDIIKLLGIPQKNEGSKVDFGLKYKDIIIGMSSWDTVRNQIKNKRKIELNVTDAIVDSINAFQSVKTRGGLKIGSSIKEVLDVFGGSSIRTDIEKIEVLSCTNISVDKYPESNPFHVLINNFSGYLLRLEYTTEGIAFYFKIDNTSSSPTVFAIQVIAKKDCQKL